LDAGVEVVMKRANDEPPAGARLAKLCGADVELGNFLLGRATQQTTGWLASRLLLREIPGMPGARALQTSQPASWQPLGTSAHADVPRLPAATGRSRRAWAERSASGTLERSTLPAYDAQDWGRKFMPGNGGCVYIDLDHLELCLPEVRSAWDHVACWHAMLRIAREALRQANQGRPPGEVIQVLVNNSDGRGNSYGGHLSFLITRRAWENLFRRRLHHLLYLASFQASSVVYTGQGKVGSENGAPPVAFQLSQRADFIETLVGLQTTYHRPLVNSRDEPLCGTGYASPVHASPDAAGMARLHVISCDTGLCPVACLLRVGVLQLILAQIEAEQVNPSLILDDPVQALRRWSRDATLEVRAKMADGRDLTAVELQLGFLEEAERFVARGGCEAIVPRAPEILALWRDTLESLQVGDLERLAPRLDWVLKLHILRRAMQQRPSLNWRSPDLKHLDHLFSSLDAADGLYWACERSGRIEQVVEDERIEHFVRNPPEDTRAWTRAMLLRRAVASEVEAMDWDFIRVRTRGAGGWPVTRTVDLANPLASGRAQCEALFHEHRRLDDLVEALAHRAAASGRGESSEAREQS
jgi:Pup amidohydrolase